MSTSVEERVAALDPKHFVEYAQFAAKQLNATGHAFVVLTPGDGTQYRISIVKPHVRDPRTTDEPSKTREGDAYLFHDKYFVATQFGPLYEWSPKNWMSWDYVADKWVTDGREWTARVIARFLNALAETTNA